MNFIDAKRAVLSSKMITIVTHKNPDGDAVGSSLGLANLLKKEGLQVRVIVPNAFPSFLSWMKGAKDILNWEKEQEASYRALNDAQVIFCLDFNAAHRVGDIGTSLLKAKGVKIMIDHHIDPEPFCDLVISDTSASSTAELVHQFIVDLELHHQIDKNIGEPIYCGIMTDTASFKHPSTSAKTHAVAADLISRGTDQARVQQLVYDSNTISRLKLIGHCLNHMEILKGQVAIFSLSSSSEHDLDLKKGDTEGIVNYGLSLKKICISAFFREDEGMIKISFRSKGHLDMNAFSRRFFQGGGHKNAAGGVCAADLKGTIKYFKASINTFFSE